ncbi:MAG: sodium-coupled permease [Planctomycetaceae bacterium]|nr:sodium-coupled permease [Planctomycetaceae bacterium]
MIFCAAPARANDSSTAAPIGLQAFDWALIGIYALSTILIGWFFGRKQTSTKEYFLGSGNMNPTLVGISLFATLLSTISYLSMPGEAVGKGPVLACGMFAYPLTYLIVAYGLLPVYMKHRVTSAYELLEVRLGLSIRLLGAVMFLVLRLFWMSLLIYLAAKAMTVMLGVGTQHIQTVVLCTGIVAVIYTSIGGLRAVVITDLMQTILLLGGAMLVIMMVTYDFGGFGWVPTTWQPHWDTQPLLSFDPRTRVTVAGTLLSLVVWQVCTAGGDQTAVQRFMSMRDVKAARHAIIAQMTVGITVLITLISVGMALMSYFSAHPEQLPANMSLTESADDMFPHYVAYHLPVGVSGLVVSAMFAAAMSSVDSGINSITAVVTTDFLDRFGKGPKTEKGHLMFSRILAFSIGVIVVFSSAYMGYIPGNISAVTNKTVNLLTAPIFGLFFFALFVPFSRPLGVWIATIVGVAVAAIIAFSGPLVTFLDAQFGIPVETFGVAMVERTNPATETTYMVAEDPISFQWVGPASLAVDLAVGTFICWLLPQKKDDRT